MNAFIMEMRRAPYALLVVLSGPFLEILSHQPARGRAETQERRVLARVPDWNWTRNERNGQRRWQEHHRDHA